MIDKQDRLSVLRGELPDHLAGTPGVYGLALLGLGLRSSLLAVDRAHMRHLAWVFAAADADLDAEEIATARLVFAAQGENLEAVENTLPSEVAEVAEFFKNRALFDVDDLATKIHYLTKAELALDAINVALDADEAFLDELHLEAEEDEG